MREFICKIEKMNEQEIKNYLDKMTDGEIRAKFEELLHHHLKETHRLHDELKDINEDKRAFREMYFKTAEALADVEENNKSKDKEKYGNNLIEK